MNPTQGSEQAGIRPIVIFQNDVISRFSTTVLTIPLTTNMRRASLPVCMKIAEGKGGLSHDSVALCFQMRAIDKNRLIKRLGQLSASTINHLENIVLVTLGYDL